MDDGLIELIHKAQQAIQQQDDGLVEVVAPDKQAEAAQDLYDPFSQSEMSEEEIYKRRIGVVEAEIEDNCVQHGVRGILEHKDIMAMIAEYTEEDKQARVYGKFQHLTGLVFKTFNRKVHVVKPFQIRPQDFCTIELLDPHPRNPDALMWIAFDSKDRAFIVDESFEKFSTNAEMAYKIKQKGAQYRIIQRRADPSLWTPDQGERSSVTMGDKLHELGLTYIHASKQRTMGIQLIQEALAYQANTVDGQLQFIKPPALYVFSSCVRTIWEFEHWQYNEWSGKAAEKNNQSEKPQDKDDHMMENLGRFFLDKPSFIEMPKFEEGSYNTGGMPQLDPYNG